MDGIKEHGGGGNNMNIEELQKKINELTKKIIFELANTEQLDDLERNINFEILLLISEELQKKRLEEKK